MSGEFIGSPRRQRWASRAALALACIGIPCLLALVGESIRSADAPQQTIDAARQVLFVAQPDGAVRVLHLRNTVGELGMLRAPQRHRVLDVALDASGHRLWVLGDDAAYCYDAYSLRLIERSELVTGLGSRFAQVGMNSFALIHERDGRTSEKTVLQ